MKPLEDWRVNRGMTGSFLCWKFKEKKAVLYKQTFLMEGTLFWMGFTWQEEVHLSRTKHNSCKQTLALGHLRPCSDDEDRGLL